MFEEDVFQSKTRKRSHAAAALVCRVPLFSCIGVKGSERLKSMRDMLSRSCCGPLSGDGYPHGFPPYFFPPLVLLVSRWVPPICQVVAMLVFLSQLPYLWQTDADKHQKSWFFPLAGGQSPAGCRHKAHLDRMKQFSPEPNFLQNPDQGSVLIRL